MTNKYEIFELTLIGPSDGNPYRDTELTAEFTMGKKEIRVPGFYDGEGTYRVRFMPLEEGSWSYETISNRPELNGKAGSFLCGPAQEGVHGPVRVADTFHFAYDDGTPFRPYGTTAYAWAVQDEDTVARSFKAFEASPFNKIRMSAFPKHYLHNYNEPCDYPFVGGRKPDVTELPPAFVGNDGKCYSFDFSHPNPAFWQYFDGIVEKLNKLSIQCDLILFHPYDRWGFSSMSQEANLQYVKYVCARYSAYPNIWWSMANEWDLLRGWSVEKWEELAAAVVSSDHVGHLHSIHNATTLYDYSKPWVTHCSLQRMHNMDVGNTAFLRKDYNKPIMWDEVCYEGDLDESFGNIPGEELTRKFWEAVMKGGYCTHGETYQNDEDIVFWAKGGDIVGKSPARIAFLRSIVEAAPGPIDPQKGFGMGALCGVSGKRFFRPANPFPQDPDFPFAKEESEFADWMLYYFGFTQSKTHSMILPEDHKYTIDLVDTWNMTVERLPGLYSGRFIVPLPSKTYMALLCRLAE